MREVASYTVGQTAWEVETGAERLEKEKVIVKAARGLYMRALWVILALSTLIMAAGAPWEWTVP